MMKILIKESRSLSTTLTSLQRKVAKKINNAELTVLVNKRHGCVEVLRGDKLLAQVYPGMLEPKQYTTTTLQAVTLADLKGMPDNTQVFRKVSTKAEATPYSVKDDSLLVNIIKDEGGVDKLNDLSLTPATEAYNRADSEFMASRRIMREDYRHKPHGLNINSNDIY